MLLFSHSPPDFCLPTFFISFTNVIKREKTINENQNHCIDRESESAIVLHVNTQFEAESRRQRKWKVDRKREKEKFNVKELEWNKSLLRFYDFYPIFRIYFHFPVVVQPHPLHRLTFSGAFYCFCSNNTINKNRKASWENKCLEFSVSALCLCIPLLTFRDHKIKKVFSHFILPASPRQFPSDLWVKEHMAVQSYRYWERNFSAAFVSLPEKTPPVFTFTRCIIHRKIPHGDKPEDCAILKDTKRHFDFVFRSTKTRSL